MKFQLAELLFLGVPTIVLGRYLAYRPSMHMVNPSKRVRRILYVFDPPCGEISICSIIWQISIYIEIICLLIAALLPHIFSFIGVLYYYFVAQWVGLGGLISIYLVLSTIFIRRK